MFLNILIKSNSSETTNKDPELVALREHVPGHGDAGVVVAGVLDLVLVLAPLLPAQQQHSDFRDILQRGVSKKILSFVLNGPLSDD